MTAAVADCFSALKSSRKKSPYCVFNKLGDLPILRSFNLEALRKPFVNRQEFIFLPGDWLEERASERERER